MVYRLSYLPHNLQQSQYIRLYGTKQRDELAPKADTKSETPWSDLCYCSNPAFIELGA